MIYRGVICNIRFDFFLLLRAKSGQNNKVLFCLTGLIWIVFFKKSKHFAALIQNPLLKLEGLRPKIKIIKLRGHVLACQGLGPRQRQCVWVHPLW